MLPKSSKPPPSATTPTNPLEELSEAPSSIDTKDTSAKPEDTVSRSALDKKEEEKELDSESFQDKSVKSDLKSGTGTVKTGSYTKTDSGSVEKVFFTNHKSTSTMNLQRVPAVVPETQKPKKKKKSGHMLVKHICDLFGGKTIEKSIKSRKTRKTDGFMSEGGYQYETDQSECESVAMQTPIQLRGRSERRKFYPEKYSTDSDRLEENFSTPDKKLSPKSQITRSNTLKNEAQSQKLAMETREKAERLLADARRYREGYSEENDSRISDSGESTPKVLNSRLSINSSRSIHSSSSPEKRSKVLSPVRRKIADLETRENCGRYLRVLSPERVANDCVCYRSTHFERF